MPINYWFHSLFTLSDNFSGIILTENMNLKVAMEKHWATKTLLTVVVGWMLKAPPLKSLGLYILVFQDRPYRGAYNMFKKMFEKSSEIRKRLKIIYPGCWH